MDSKSNLFLHTLSQLAQNFPSEILEKIINQLPDSDIIKAVVLFRQRKYFKPILHHIYTEKKLDEIQNFIATKWNREIKLTDYFWIPGIFVEDVNNPPTQYEGIKTYPQYINIGQSRIYDASKTTTIDIKFEFSTKLKDLIYLESLYAKYITEIPNWIGELPHLKKLFIENSEISEIPRNLNNLTALGFAFVRFEKSLTLPSNMNNLVSFTWHKNSDWIRGVPSHIKRLNLCGNELTEFPTILQNFYNLEDLELEDNSITIIPNWIGKFKHLQTLNLSYNKIRTISPEIGNLKHLKNLYLQNNDITELPEEIGNLNNLEFLEIS